MIYLVVIIIAIISVLLAARSVWKQNKFEEVGKVKNELKKKKVVFHRDSHSSS